MATAGGVTGSAALAELPADQIKRPAISEAVDEKIAEQAAFVANWDAQVRPAGYQGNIAAGQYYTSGPIG